MKPDRLTLFHNCLYGMTGIGQREQFISDKSLVSACFQMAEDFLIIDLAGSGLVASRSVRYMDMTELVAIIADGIADTAFIDLHMIDIVQ